jgi:hypothetical protein
MQTADATVALGCLRKVVCRVVKAAATPDGPTRVKIPNGHRIPARHTDPTTNTFLLGVYIH